MIKNTDVSNVIIPQKELVNIYDSEIGEGTSIGAFTEIGGAVIGKNCKIQAHVFIPPGIVIYDDVFIGPGVRFCNVKYPISTRKARRPFPETRVKSYVTIGANATILPGLYIQTGTFIGAGSVLTRSVSNHFGLWFGNPAKCQGMAPDSSKEREFLRTVGIVPNQ